MSTIVTLLICCQLAMGFSPSPHFSSRKTPSKSNIAYLLSAATTEMPEGLVKTVTKPGNGPPLKLGDVASVKYSCYLPDEAPFARSEFQKVVSFSLLLDKKHCFTDTECIRCIIPLTHHSFLLYTMTKSVGDGSMIDGWEKAIRTMNVGERAVVRITNPDLGYGETGVPPLIPANAEIELDLEILDAQPPLDAINFDTLAMSQDMTPRTAGSIAAAYEERQLNREEEKEGLEGFIEKVRNFYFFGFFEGETGQQAPWFLRPSITFPIAFLIVGATFYVSYLGGAITERGAQVTDELDEIILNNLVLTSKSVLTVLLSSSNGGIDL